MGRYKVLVTARSFAMTDESPIHLLESNGCEVVRIKSDNGDIHQQLEEQLPGADAVIAGLDIYDRDLIMRAEKLRVISRYGVGYDNVDLDVANEKGVKVTITVGVNEASVSDMAMALMLAAARNISYMDLCIKQKNQKRPIGLEIWGKTLGVVGVGRIGKGVVKRAKGFDMKILCYDMFPDNEFALKYDIQYVDFDTILKESDFITIHTPLNDKTRNLFSTEQFRAMKKSSVLINTARGGIIDEAALYKALLTGEIAAAALDTTEKEPPYESPLLNLPNCTITPHMGGNTYDAVNRMSMMAAQNVLDILLRGECAFAITK